VFSLDRGLLMGAKSTSSTISISSTYIVFLTKMQKRQITEKGFALIENDITTFELASRFQINCRNLQFSPKNWDG